MSGSNVPVDKTAAGVSPTCHTSCCGTPLVLQVSPLPGSPGVDEFYYDAFGDVESGDFATARAFFIHQGHTVIFHDCPNAMAFQALYPLASIGYISSLPDFLINEGHLILQAQLRLCPQEAARAPPPAIPYPSIINRYIAGGFRGTVGVRPDAFAGSVLVGGSCGDIPSASAASSDSSPSRRSTSDGPTVVAKPHCHGNRPGHSSSSSKRPDPDGFNDSSLPSYGGMRSVYGRSFRCYGGFPAGPSWYPPFGLSGFGHVSSVSRPFFYDHGGSYGYGRPQSLPWEVQYFDSVDHPFGQAGLGPHAAASVASSIGDTILPLQSLPHADSCSALASSSDTPSVAQVGVGAAPVPIATVPPTAPSFLPVHPVPVAVSALPAAPAGFIHAPVPVPVASPSGGLIPPQVSAVVAPLVAPWIELLKIDPIKDTKSFLDSFETIQYYLRMPKFSTGRADDSLATDASNAEASQAWEGQLRLALKDGGLHHLFENKGSTYHGWGFEMLDVLICYCRPDMVFNAFASLLSLFNDVQGESEPFLEYPSRFDGLTLELSRCKVVLPHLLSVMLFLRGLHSWYNDIVTQFWSGHKSIKMATINSIVSDVTFHDRFTLVESKIGKSGGSSGSTPCVPAAMSANTDRQGNVWQTSFEWLAKNQVKGIKQRWSRAMAGNGICPVCHCDKKPLHVPTQCPLLKDLGFKLITCPAATPGMAPPVPAAAASSTTPAAPVPPLSGVSTSAVPGSLGSVATPAALVASVIPAVAPVDEYDTDDDFHWDGDECGITYGAPAPKLSAHTLKLLPFLLLAPLPSHSLHIWPRSLPRFLSLLHVIQWGVVLRWLTLGRLIIWSPTSRRSSLTSPSLISTFGWAKTLTYRCRDKAPPSLVSTASKCSFGTSFTFLAWRYLSIASALT
jgi:hypothetical protein